MTKATINYRHEKTHMMSAVDRSFTDQSTLQEDERLGLSFMDTHNYGNRGRDGGRGIPGSCPGSRNISEIAGLCTQGSVAGIAAV